MTSPQYPPAWFLQFDNISNKRAHMETTGPEIWNQTDGQIDAVTFSTGTGGTLAGKDIYSNYLQ